MPSERAFLKTVPKYGVGDCVHFCLRSLGPSERRVRVKTNLDLTYVEAPKPNVNLIAWWSDELPGAVYVTWVASWIAWGGKIVGITTHQINWIRPRTTGICMS